MLGTLVATASAAADSAQPPNPAHMQNEQSKDIYKERASTAEWINAQFRSQGLTKFLVRGTEKVLAVALVHAITHNMRRSWALA